MTSYQCDICGESIDGDPYVCAIPRSPGHAMSRAEWWLCKSCKSKLRTWLSNQRRCHASPKSKMGKWK